ncbi:SGNH/GDSL hydrolase family protein [Sunxiuqinia sp. A32]|uniref:SGNH/GDSL hydrolase family protein n=1 Tax=Sunxiuqinia sp. A32 TaxID=3461496 RepID=UPI004045DDF8
MNLKRLYLVVFTSILFICAQGQTPVPLFKKGERVVFVGNSITHRGRYHSFIWLYYMTRFPDMPITVFNAGVGGDKSWDIEERLDDDIFSKKPTYLTLTFGMNDVGYRDFFKDNAQEIAKQQIQKSFDHYKVIEKRLQDEKELTKVIIGGSPYDETSKIERQIFPTKNEALLKVNDFQRASAKANGWGFVDFARPMMEINMREEVKDSLFTLCGKDRVHPDNDGQMVMAYLFLKAQGLANKKVAEVSVNAEASKVESTDNCTVSDLKGDENGLSFNYLANALPYPVDSIPRGKEYSRSQMDALRLIPFTKEFNQELLIVSELSGGNYQLLIDGQPIARYSALELADGINMAELTNTPQYQQAMKIMLLNENRVEIERLFRDYAWMEFSFLQEKGLLFADNQVALDSIKADWNKARRFFKSYQKAQYPGFRQECQNEMDGIVKMIYTINKPVSHAVELSKVL